MGLLSFLGISSIKEISASDSSFQSQLKEPLNLQDKDPEKRKAAVEAYQQNYSKVYQKLTPNWQKIFKEMASTSMGQEIIANLPQNFSVSIVDPDELEGAGAAYYHGVNRFLLSEVTALGLTGAYGRNDAYEALFHEMRHAMQDSVGISRLSGPVSAYDSAMNSFLIEADAHAVAKSEKIIRDVFSSPHLSKKEINALMKKDLYAKYIKEQQDRYNKGKPLSKQQKEMVINVVKFLPEYRVQQALKKANGDLSKARLYLRSEVFKSYWNGGFSNVYEQQALDLALVAVEDKVVPNNPDLQKQIVEAVAKKNGLSPDWVTKSLKTSESFQECMVYMQEHPEADGGELKKVFDQNMAFNNQVNVLLQQYLEFNRNSR